jgi:hypothetical protein
MMLFDGGIVESRAAAVVLKTQEANIVLLLVLFQTNFP